MFDRVPVRACTRWRAAAVVAATAVVGAAWAQDAHVALPALKNDSAPRVLRPAGATDMSKATLPRFAFAGGQNAVNAGALNRHGGAIPAGGPCMQPVANCQLPDQAGHGSGGIIGATSDLAAGFEVVENFQIDAGGSVTTICWWGFYLDFDTGNDCSAEVPVDAFTARFYSNDPACPDGAPASLLATRTLTAARAPTGNMVGGNMEFEYSAAISPAVAVGPGACTWVSIQNDTSGTSSPNCVWLWSTADGDGDSHQIGAPDPENDFDLAMCLNLPLGNTDCGLPPLAECVAPCPWDCGNGDGLISTADLLALLGDWGDAGSPCDFDGGVVSTSDLLKLLGNWGECPNLPGDCGAPHAGTGCSDQCCCTTVCLLDSFCCDTEWDQTCADNAIAAGCATFPLCEGQDDTTCQLYSLDNASNSTAGSFHTADDFTPVSNGMVQDLCWQGVYGNGTPSPDSFRARILNDLDGDGFPENELYNQVLGNIAEDDTGNEIFGLPVFQYEATLAPGLAVTAGDCYWLEITNDLGGADFWFWEWAESGPNQADPLKVPRQGNARYLQDFVPVCSADSPNAGDPCTSDAECAPGTCSELGTPDGYTFEDLGVDHDMSFCVGLQINDSACGFLAMHHTGPHETVAYDAANGGNYGPTHLGWSSGNLGAGDTHRRCVQAFTLPALPGGAVWSIEQVLVEGFDPGGVTNESLNFEFFSRTALDVAPTPADLQDVDGDAIPDTITVGFGDPTGTETERTGFIATGITLPPGDYWMTMYASNAANTTANFAWFTNAMCNEANGDNCINNACTEAMQPAYGGSVGCFPAPGGDPPGTPAMWRAHVYPTPGFGAYTLPATTLTVDEANDSEPNPADLYNAAFYIRGTPVPP